MGQIDEVPCPNCKRTFKEHVAPDLKCLFEASKFEITEGFRIALSNDINSEKLERDALEKKYGRVWSTSELKQFFDVQGFLAPFVKVTRKEGTVAGAMMFQHMPRYYFNFIAD